VPLLARLVSHEIAHALDGHLFILVIKQRVVVVVIRIVAALL
jgi:peptide deformylase